MTSSKTRRFRPGVDRLEGRALLAAPYYGYALDLGGPTNSATNGVAADSAGNAVVSGQFIGTVHLDPNNPANPAGTLNFQAGYYDSTGTWHITPAAYVARYDPAGNLLWAQGFGGGGSTGASAEGRHVAVDGSGNIYAEGDFGGTITLGSDASGNPVTVGPPADTTDAATYVVKYSPAGVVQWALNVTRYSNPVMTVDVQGDVFLSDTFGGTRSVGGRTLSSTNGNQYLAKIQTDGTFAWVDQFNLGSSYYIFVGLTADGAGNAYLTGDFSGTADFDPGPGTYSLFSGGNSKSPNMAAFVEKVNSSGGLAWAVAFQATGTGRFNGSHAAALAVAVDPAGDVYATGNWGGTVDFDPASKTTDYLSAGSGGMYVTKLTPSGQFAWAEGLGGSASITPTAIAVDPSGNVDLTGTFTGTANFNPGGTYTLTSAKTASGSYASDAFAVQLNGAGAFMWAASGGGAGGAVVSGIAVDGYGNVYIAGSFAGTGNFDPNGTQTLTAQASGQDGFLWKLKRTP